MKSILHLKDDTEYQIPLRETEKNNRAEVGTTTANSEVESEKEAEKVDDKKNVNNEGETAVAQSQDELHDAQKSKNDKTDQLRADSALANLEEEKPQQSTEGTTPEASNEAPASETPETLDDTLKKLRELSTVEGEITPQVFIDHYKSILNLIEHAMQLRIRESSSTTEQKPEPDKEVEKETQENTSDK